MMMERRDSVILTSNWNNQKWEDCMIEGKTCQISQKEVLEAMLNQNNLNNNINNINEIPMEEMKIKPSGWNNNAAFININRAVQENRGKKEYTAHTYSTIQKIKNLNEKKKKKSKKLNYFIFSFYF